MKIRWPKFNWDFNFGHILVMMGMFGSALLYVRANEMHAMQADIINAKDIEALKHRADVFESNQRRFAEQMAKIDKNQESTARILEHHLALFRVNSSDGMRQQ